MMRATCGVVLALLAAQSAWAQSGGGATQAQLQSMRNANNATMSSDAAQESADSGNERSQRIKADLQPAYSGWTQAQINFYVVLIASGDTNRQTGGIFYALAASEKSKGLANYSQAQALWSIGDFAGAASLYDQAVIYYKQSVEDFSGAAAAYGSAASKYQQALDYYDGHTPPIIRTIGKGFEKLKSHRDRLADGLRGMILGRGPKSAAAD